MAARAVEEVVAVIRAPPGTAGTRKAGPPKIPAMNDARNPWRPPKTSHTTIRNWDAVSATIKTSSIPPTLFVWVR